MVSKLDQQILCKKTLLLNSRFILPEWWCVVGNDDQFGLALTQCLQGLFVSQAEFAGFHDQSQTGIGGFQSLFLLHIIEIEKKKENEMEY